MILSCPNCATKYTLNEAQLGPRGRTVRCAACKTTWHAEIPEKPIDLSFSDVKKQKEPAEELHEVKAKKLPLKYRAMLNDQKRVKALTAQGMIWGGLGAVLVLLLVLGYFLRVDIVRMFPSVAGAYAMVGMDVKGTPLRFGTIDGQAGFKGGRFVVTVKAQVNNTSGKAVPVPPVRVKLLDAKLQEFSSLLMPADGLVVGPHATRTLVFDVADPKNLTSSLDVDFDLVAMKQEKTQKKGGHAPSEHEAAPAGHEEAAAQNHEEVAQTDGPMDHDAPPANSHGAVSNMPTPSLRTGLTQQQAGHDAAPAPAAHAAGGH
ncbi:hypothetical protein AEAC466_01815 [Asticcacaulis sp. AC466]|uniref:MJ0042-type zinc finger domain-containing protein n=1 Tax=Asticcacaulis sp. AC466 TaxID=1282362 RepID=UPI0003C3C7F6|nr:MJ0042-type zinc finger domain-containing protein [Asticcacaulis sp. AC466]ESQ85943.1 hypothetical protein AEAC466_01815 [Asticcacaulis sp. AC466]